MNSDAKSQSPPTPAKAQMRHAAGSPPKLLRLPQVVEMIGFQRAWIYKSMKSGAFVPAVKVGRATRWPARAVESWIAAQLPQGSESSL